MTYYEQLQHPLWREKREEVLKLHSHRCLTCEATEDDTYLHVHHRFYRRGAKAWEYSTSELVCLCERCHYKEHKWRDELARELAFFDIDQIKEFLGYIKEGQLLALWQRAREVAKEAADGGVDQDTSSDV